MMGEEISAVGPRMRPDQRIQSNKRINKHFRDSGPTEPGDSIPRISPDKSSLQEYKDPMHACATPAPAHGPRHTLKPATPCGPHQVNLFHSLLYIIRGHYDG
jgi:hypothetical protein